MTNKNKALEITKSTGNVFKDLEVANPEEYLVKSALAYQINQIIMQKKLNQIDAAKLLGIDQPKISALSRGRLTGFSIERLFKFLAILNQDIEITIRPHKKVSNSSIDTPHVFVRDAEA
jgi:predicted XRE-type DNA-binding protein